jgi:Ca-activated chloride channel family protein
MRNLVRLSCAAMLALSAGRMDAQSVRSLINEGNALYETEKYSDAEVRYRKALEKDRQSAVGKYNLGNALQRQGKFDEAMKQYELAADPRLDAATRAKAFYNAGNSLLRQQKYQEAIGPYVESLKLNPDDYDAKYNLSYALEMLKRQQQQQQNKDKKKDQQDKDQQKKDQQQQQQPQQDKGQQQRPQQQERKMSKADAERILDVLKNNERDVQKKLRARQPARPRTDKDW